MLVSQGPQQPTRCPLCDAPTQPADFHVLPTPDGILWTYECLGCGEEKPCTEWVELHRAKYGTRKN